MAVLRSEYSELETMAEQVLDRTDTKDRAAQPELIQPVHGGSIRLEASSACQLRCPSCPTTTGHTSAVVGKNVLRLADFVALVDANPWVAHIELSNNGEVFLNPDLIAIFRHAYERDVKITLENGVNLNHVRDEALQALVRYRIATVRCSIDGASQETYVRYRVRGNFDRVIANIRRINELKREQGTKFPYLIWQFVVFGHNEHEIEKARWLATDLGMAFQVKLSWDPDLSPVKDKDVIRAKSGTGAASREEYSKKHGKEYLENICDQLWTTPQINWDGKVLGCCRNFWGDFGGNAFRDGLVPSLNHEKLSYARRMLEGRAPPRDDIPCTTCELYTARKDRARWYKVHPMLSRSDTVSIATAMRNATAMAQGERWRLAADWARLVLQLQPGHTQALAMVGTAAERRGRQEAARYYFEKAGVRTEEVTR